MGTFSPVELIGVSLYGNPETTFFHTAWEYFGTVADEASLSRIGKNIYGLQIYHPQFPKIFELTYMACMIKEKQMDVPIRMVSKKIPECQDAAQKVAGGVKGVDDAIRYLYQDHIPENGLRTAMPLHFEKCCDVKDHDSVPEDIEIWVPVQDV